MVEGVPPVGVGSYSSVTSFNLARRFEDRTDQRKLPAWPCLALSKRTRLKQNQSTMGTQVKMYSLLLYTLSLSLMNCEHSILEISDFLLMLQLLMLEPWRYGTCAPKYCIGVAGSIGRAKH
jgi:hypothetical protein